MLLETSLMAAMLMLQPREGGPTPAPAPAAASESTNLRLRAQLRRASRRSDGSVIFRLSEAASTFLVPANARERARAWEILQAASKAPDTLIEVTFDLDSGRLQDREPIFSVSSMTIGETRVVIEPPAAPPPPLAEPEKLFLHGAAYMSVGDYARAKGAFAKAASASSPDPLLSQIALVGSASAKMSEAEALHRWNSPEADAAYASALRDLMRMENPFPTALAQALMGLGAYDAAVRLFEGMATWAGGSDPWPFISVSMAHRALGNTDEALRALERSLEAAGSPNMPYHYHRGLTLDEAGRSEEAVQEFTAGLEHQPGYWAAFAGRACARAKLGRLNEAVADQERSLALQEATPPEPRDRRAWEHDVGRSREILAELRRRLAANPNQPTTVACDGFWGWSREGRKASPLLAEIPELAPLLGTSMNSPQTE